MDGSSAAAGPIRVLVVDDHPLMRRGLLALLGAQPQLQVVGEAGDAGEAQRHAAALQPDVILLDNHLPGVRGVDALPGLREVAPRARVLMLTVSEDEVDLAAALRGGARGYLLKTVDSRTLVASIERVMRGESPVSPQMSDKLVAAFRALPAAPGDEAPSPPPEAPDPIDTLSPREREILALIAHGASNKEIGRKLDIAETTVKIHVQHILRKLNLSSRVKAAVYAAARL